VNKSGFVLKNREYPMNCIFLEKGEQNGTNNQLSGQLFFKKGIVV
jgi:hypothetical protein